MRLYDILSGILLILSIIGIAPAAPVIGQKKFQPSLEPKDITNTLGKRVRPGEEEEILKMWGDVFQSDDGATTIGPASGGAPTLASSTNTGTVFDTTLSNKKPEDHEPKWPHDASADESLGYGPDEEFMKAHSRPAAKVRPLVDTGTTSSSEDSDYEPNWPHDASAGESSGYDSDRQFIEHARPVDPTISPWVDTGSTSSGSDLDGEYWVNSKDPAPPRPASSKESGQPHGNQAPSPSAGPPTEPGQEEVTTPSLTGAGH